MPGVHSFLVLPALPEKLKALETIARNMYWSWNPECVELFKRIDSILWNESGHNPVKFLGNISQERLNTLEEDQAFVGELQRVEEKLKRYLESPTWFEKVSGKCSKPVIAYFCAEFGIHECLPFYSGGLGVLAGDHLKERFRFRNSLSWRRPAVPKRLFQAIPEHRRVAAGSLC